MTAAILLFTSERTVRRDEAAAAEGTAIGGRSAAP